MRKHSSRILGIVLVLSVSLNIFQFVRWSHAFDEWAHRYHDALVNTRITGLDRTMEETRQSELSQAMALLYFAPSDRIGKFGDYLATLSGQHAYAAVAQDLGIITQAVWSKGSISIPTPGSSMNPSLPVSDRKVLQKVYLIYAAKFSNDVVDSHNKAALNEALNAARQDITQLKELDWLVDRLTDFWGDSYQPRS